MFKKSSIHSRFQKSRHFLEKLRLLRKSSIFIKKSILKYFKHFEREERRQIERETKKNHPGVRVFLAGTRLTVHRQFAVRKLCELVLVFRAKRVSMI